MAEAKPNPQDEFWTPFKSNRLTLWGEKGSNPVAPCASLLVTHSGVVKFQVRMNSGLSNDALNFAFGSGNEGRNYFVFLELIKQGLKLKDVTGNLFSIQCKTWFGNNVRLETPKTTHLLSLARDENGILSLVFTVRDTEIKFPFRPPTDFITLDHNNEPISNGISSELQVIGWAELMGTMAGTFFGTSLRAPAPKGGNGNSYSGGQNKGNFKSTGAENNFSDFDDVA